jgi:hypothetical protein
MARRTNMPTVAADAITATILHWYDDLIGRVMTAEASRALVRRDLVERLTRGTLDIAWVIEAANAGHRDAELALRAYAATFVDQGRLHELPRQIQGYAAGALLRDITAYPRGKNIIDVLSRNIAISVMVDAAAARWSLPPTRGRGTDEPSAAYFVGLAMRKRGIKLKEQQVNRIHKDHNKLAARLAASMSAPFENSSKGW